MASTKADYKNFTGMISPNKAGEIKDEVDSILNEDLINKVSKIISIDNADLINFRDELFYALNSYMVSIEVAELDVTKGSSNKAIEELAQETEELIRKLNSVDINTKSLLIYSLNTAPFEFGENPIISDKLTSKEDVSDARMQAIAGNLELLLQALQI